MYRKAARKAASIILSTRDGFYKDRLQECSGDAKQTYSVVNKLLNKERFSTAVPSSSSNSTNACNFAEFFKGKVDKIYDGINLERKNFDDSKDVITETRTLQLTSFSPVSDEELTSVIKSMSKKF